MSVAFSRFKRPPSCRATYGGTWGMKLAQLQRELDSKQVTIRQLRNDKMLVERKLARREKNLTELKQALGKEEGHHWVRNLLKKYKKKQEDQDGTGSPQEETGEKNFKNDKSHKKVQNCETDKLNGKDKDGGLMANSKAKKNQLLGITRVSKGTFGYLDWDKKEPQDDVSKGGRKYRGQFSDGSQGTTM